MASIAASSTSETYGKNQKTVSTRQAQCASLELWRGPRPPTKIVQTQKPIDGRALDSPFLHIFGSQHASDGSLQQRHPDEQGLARNRTQPSSDSSASSLTIARASPRETHQRHGLPHCAIFRQTARPTPQTLLSDSNSNVQRQQTTAVFPSSFSRARIHSFWRSAASHKGCSVCCSNGLTDTYRKPLRSSRGWLTSRQNTVQLVPHSGGGTGALHWGARAGGSGGHPKGLWQWTGDWHVVSFGNLLVILRTQSVKEALSLALPGNCQGNAPIANAKKCVSSEEPQRSMDSKSWCRCVEKKTRTNIVFQPFSLSRLPLSLVTLLLLVLGVRSHDLVPAFDAF